MSIVDAPFTANSHTRFWTDGSLTISSPYAKTYGMGGASNSHTLAAVQLSVDLYPLLRQQQCQLHLRSTEQEPDLSITCGQRHEHIFIHLDKKQITVYAENFSDQQRLERTFTATDTLSLATVRYSIPVSKLLK